MLSDAGCIGLSPALQPIARASPTACYSAGYQSRLGLGCQLEWCCPGKSNCHCAVGGQPVPAAGPVTVIQVQVVLGA
jgi:hypothetical protein